MKAVFGSKAEAVTNTLCVLEAPECTITRPKAIANTPVYVDTSCSFSLNLTVSAVLLIEIWIYEEIGVTLSGCRLDTKYPLCNMFKLFMCAVCQVEIKPGEGISIHAGVSNSGKLRPWDGPFLCLGCQEKKEAMEGKRPSGGMSPHSCIPYGCIWVKDLWRD